MKGPTGAIRPTRKWQPQWQSSEELTCRTDAVRPGRQADPDGCGEARKAGRPSLAEVLD